MWFARGESVAGAAAGVRQAGQRRFRQGAKRALLSVMRQSGVFHLSSLKHRQSIPILCYHGAWMVDDGFPGDAMFIRPETFSRRMQLIRDLDLHVISLDDAVAALSGDGEAPDNAVVITIEAGAFGSDNHLFVTCQTHLPLAKITLIHIAITVGIGKGVIAINQVR